MEQSQSLEMLECKILSKVRALWPVGTTPFCKIKPNQKYLHKRIGASPKIHILFSISVKTARATIQATSPISKPRDNA